ncbi:hypothetical protein Ciccas_001965 [Cichlidogyrus casuarinus]|uniref:Uncharacterized protein n=1 Tax=Cichlidogyrus casuarinus TaxID=1844966 RepID=A0ABD2QIJ6_9PLAT
MSMAPPLPLTENETKFGSLINFDENLASPHDKLSEPAPYDPSILDWSPHDPGVAPDWAISNNYEVVTTPPSTVAEEPQEYESAKRMQALLQKITFLESELETSKQQQAPDDRFNKLREAYLKLRKEHLDCLTQVSFLAVPINLYQLNEFQNNTGKLAVSEIEKEDLSNLTRGTPGDSNLSDLRDKLVKSACHRGIELIKCVEKTLPRSDSESISWELLADKIDSTLADLDTVESISSEFVISGNDEDLFNCEKMHILSIPALSIEH